MSHEQNPSDHISDQKLHELARPSLIETGSVAMTSILTPQEAAHFQRCVKCVDALANVARELIKDLEKKKKASKDLK